MKIITIFTRRGAIAFDPGRYERPYCSDQRYKILRNMGKHYVVETRPWWKRILRIPARIVAEISFNDNSAFITIRGLNDKWEICVE
ncbi:MAG: hypothetical protein KatS3mg023_3669 [Armatimonadota bacterium]|nr:MAG: hypothetical protein KatS3mg023_3669 [Armatimonadota bacterium]